MGVVMPRRFRVGSFATHRALRNQESGSTDQAGTLSWSGVDGATGSGSGKLCTMSEPVRLAVKDTERAFAELLRRNGVSLEAMPFLAVWRCFKQFAETPVDTPSDGLLYEWGIYESATDEFNIHFLRQFEVVYPDGEHDRFEQLNCDWTFAVTDALRELPGDPLPGGTWRWPLERPSYVSWWFPGQGVPLASWIGSVESRPEFSVVQTLVPLGTAFGQGAV
jgi:hypothetical protein